MLARKTVLVVVALLVAIPAGMALGAPFAYVSIEARVQGSGAEFSSLVPVKTPTPLEYRITFQMADISGGPITNTSATPAKVLSSLVAGTDGANSLKFHVYESATDQIQVSFADAASLAVGWADNAGFAGGVVTPRGNGANDLLNVRPIRAAGTFAGITSVLVASGVANVIEVGTGADSIVTGAQVLPVKVGGSIWSAIKINGGTLVNQTSTDAANVDPYIGYKALVLYTPFATSGIEGVPADGFKVNPGEDLVLSGLGGGHAGVGSTYQWTIASGPPLVYQGQDWTVPWADLLSLGYGDHTITLDVNTADGEHSSTQAALTILPEPTTMALLAVGAVALIRRRRTA